MLSITSAVNTLKRVVGENTHLVDIQHADILNYRKELLTGLIVNPAMPNTAKWGRAPSTVNKQMAVLSEMLKLANRSQFILHAPYEGVSRLKLSKNDPDPLLLHEYQALIAALPRKLALIIIVSVHTGMRPGEICALAWEDIDLKKGEVHVSRSLTNKRVFVPPKTDAGIRTITLLKPALDALQEQYKITGQAPKKEIQFHHCEIGKTERQNLRFVFTPEERSSIGDGFFPNIQFHTDGNGELKFQEYVRETLISQGIHMPAGRWWPGRTRHSLPARWGMRMLAWCMRFIPSGLVTWTRIR